MRINSKNAFAGAADRRRPRTAFSTQRRDLSRSANSGSTPKKHPRAGGTLRRVLLIEHALANTGFCHEISYRLYADELGVSLSAVSVRYTFQLPTFDSDLSEARRAKS
ncbi:hypothetical protein ACVIYL_004385 [Bradyrhizobium sp. USDA 3315]